MKTPEEPADAEQVEQGVLLEASRSGVVAVALVALEGDGEQEGRSEHPKLGLGRQDRRLSSRGRLT